jgi:hypothetical protein
MYHLRAALLVWLPLAGSVPGAADWDHYNNEKLVGSVIENGFFNKEVPRAECQAGCWDDPSCKGFNYEAGTCEHHSKTEPRMEQLGCTVYQALARSVEHVEAPTIQALYSPSCSADLAGVTDTCVPPPAHDAHHAATYRCCPCPCYVPATCSISPVMRARSALERVQASSAAQSAAWAGIT